ncbi:MAG: hypothetical protein R3B70_07320 [Polyangiaceae bacterium]
MTVTPARWVLAPLGQFLSAIETGKSFQCEERPPNSTEVGVAKVSAVSWGEYDENESKTCLEPERINPDLYVQAGDFLFSRANTIDLVGACVIARQVSKRVMLSDKLLRFRTQCLNPHWLLYFLRSEAGRRQIEDLSSGNQLSMRNIAQARVREIVMPIPPLPEQARAAEKIRTLETRSRRAREALDEVPGLLEKLRQSILAAAFRGDLTRDWRAKNPDVEPAEKLLQRIRTERRKKWEESELARLTAKGKPPTDDRWKAKYVEPECSNLDDPAMLPPGWQWTSVQSLGFIESGQTPEGIAEYSGAASRDVPWFRVGDMNSPENHTMMLRAEIWLSHQDIKSFGLSVRPAGAIIFPKRGGAIATNKKRRLERNSTYDLNIMGVIPVPSVAEYLWQWFQSIDLATLNTGTTVPQINHGDIAPLPVPLPPENELVQIVARVDASLAQVRSISTAVTTTREDLAGIDKAILSKTFRGELVHQDQADEPASVMLARLKATAAESPSLLPCQTQAPRPQGLNAPAYRAQRIAPHPCHPLDWP